MMAGMTGPHRPAPLLMPADLAVMALAALLTSVALLLL